MKYVASFTFGLAVSLLIGFAVSDDGDDLAKIEHDLLGRYVEFVNFHFKAPIDAGPCETLSFAQMKAWSQNHEWAEKVQLYWELTDKKEGSCIDPPKFGK